MSNPSTPIRLSEMYQHLQSLFELASYKLWVRQKQKIDALIQRQPHLAKLYKERFSLLFSIIEIESYRRKTGHLPFAHDHDQYSAYTFIKTCALVRQQISDRNYKKLQGALRHAIKDETGLASLAFEFDVASILITNGFKVEFTDLETEANFDLTATRDGVRVNVECKTIGPDTGNPVTTLQTAKLAADIFSKNSAAIDQLEGGHLFIIDIQEGLDRKLEQTINEKMQNVFAGSCLQEQEGSVVLTHHIFDLSLLPFVIKDGDLVPQVNLRDVFEKNFGVNNEPGMGMFSPNKRAIFIIVRSSTKSSLFENAYQRIKEGGRQLPPDFPGALFIRFLDLSDGDVIALNEADQKHLKEKSDEVTSVKAMAVRLFVRDDMQHIHSVWFVGKGFAEHEYSTDFEDAIIGKNSIYHFNNLRCSHPITFLQPNSES